MLKTIKQVKHSRTILDYCSPVCLFQITLRNVFQLYFNNLHSNSAKLSYAMLHLQLNNSFLFNIVFAPLSLTRRRLCSTDREGTNERFPTSLAQLDFIDWNRVGLISGSPTDVQAEFVYQLPGWLMSSDKGPALALISDVHRPLRPLKRPYLRRDQAIRPPWTDLIALTSSGGNDGGDWEESFWLLFSYCRCRSPCFYT